MLLRLKECTRCLGDMEQVYDDAARALVWVCIQCGREEYTAADRRAMARLRRERELGMRWILELIESRRRLR